jgi:HEPN domain-containing protein
MSFEEIELLRKRAETFLRNALYLINENGAERQLIRELGGENPKMLVLINEVRNLHYIARIEEAYISSRYLPFKYTVEEVKDISRFVLEVFKPLVDSV